MPFRMAALCGLLALASSARADDHWREEPLATIGRHPDLALGADGRLHLVYARCASDGAPRGIGYRVWSDGSWGPEETVHEGLVACRPSGQNRPRVAVAPGDEVHVVFAEDIVRDPNPPRYLRRDAGGWSGAESLPVGDRRVEFVDVAATTSGPLVAAMMIPREGFTEDLAGAFVLSNAGDWQLTELGSNDPGKDLELTEDGERIHAVWRWVLPPDGELRHYLFEGSWTDAGSLDRPDGQSTLWPSAVPGDPFGVVYVAYEGATVNGVWSLEDGAATRLSSAPIRDEDRRAVAVPGRAIWVGADGTLRQAIRGDEWSPETTLHAGPADYPAMVRGGGWTHVVFQDPETKRLHHLALPPPPMPDGGVPEPDGGARPDGGAADAGTPSAPADDGCGCSSSPPSASCGWLALVALALRRRSLAHSQTRARLAR